MFVSPPLLFLPPPFTRETTFVFSRFYWWWGRRPKLIAEKESPKKLSGPIFENTPTRIRANPNTPNSISNEAAGSGADAQGHDSCLFARNKRVRAKYFADIAKSKLQNEKLKQ